MVLAATLLTFVPGSLRADEIAPAPPVEYSTELSGTGPGGAFTVHGVVAGGYLTSAVKGRLVRELADEARQAGRDVTGLTVIVYGPYNSDLFASDGEEIRWHERPYRFVNFLHDECYHSIDYERDDAATKQRKKRTEIDCYVRFTTEYLAGHTLAYEIFSIWGVSPGDVDLTNPFAIPGLVLTLLLFSVPQLGLYLLFVGLLRNQVRDESTAQRVLKLVPVLVIGFAWFYFWIALKASGTRLPGVLNSFDDWLWLSGVFFALNFIACMFLADHCFFPENDPPGLVWVAIFYLFGPLLMIVAGGAASGGGSGRGTATNTTQAGGASGRVVGGGGTFGGGGASGTF